MANLKFFSKNNLTLPADTLLSLIEFLFIYIDILKIVTNFYKYLSVLSQFCLFLTYVVLRLLGNRRAKHKTHFHSAISQPPLEEPIFMEDC